MNLVKMTDQDLHKLQKEIKGILRQRKLSIYANAQARRKVVFTEMLNGALAKDLAVRFNVAQSAIYKDFNDELYTLYNTHKEHFNQKLHIENIFGKKIRFWISCREALLEKYDQPG